MLRGDVVAAQAAEIADMTTTCQRTRRAPGVVHAYDLVAGTWTFRETIVPDDAEPRQRFGASLALEVDRAIIGAPDDSASAEDERRLGLRALRDADPMACHAGLLNLGCDEEPRVPASILRLLRSIARDATAPPASRTLAAGLALTIEVTGQDVRLPLSNGEGGAECWPGRDAIEAHPDVTVPWIEKLALESGPAQQLALEMLRRVGRTLGPAGCAQVVASRTPSVRAEVVNLYLSSRWSSPGVLPCLPVLRDDPRDWVREHAAAAVPCIAPHDVSAIRRAAATVEGSRRSTGLSLSPDAGDATLEALTRPDAVARGSGPARGQCRRAREAARRGSSGLPRGVADPVAA